MKSLIFLPEMARIMCKTERAMYALCQRKSKMIPAPFKFGCRWAWKRKQVEKWLESME